MGDLSTTTGISTVYKTFLTFNEDGSMEWSEPERLLGQNDEYREVESREDFCEVEIIRSPDGNELAALFRANAALHLSPTCPSPPTRA